MLSLPRDVVSSILTYLPLKELSRSSVISRSFQSAFDPNDFRSSPRKVFCEEKLCVHFDPKKVTWRFTQDHDYIKVPRFCSCNKKAFKAGLKFMRDTASLEFFNYYRCGRKGCPVEKMKKLLIPGVVEVCREQSRGVTRSYLLRKQADVSTAGDVDLEERLAPIPSAAFLQLVESGDQSRWAFLERLHLVVLKASDLQLVVQRGTFAALKELKVAPLVVNPLSIVRIPTDWQAEPQTTDLRLVLGALPSLESFTIKASWWQIVCSENFPEKLNVTSLSLTCHFCRQSDATRLYDALPKLRRLELLDPFHESNAVAYSLRALSQSSVRVSLTHVAVPTLAALDHDEKLEPSSLLGDLCSLTIFSRPHFEQSSLTFSHLTTLDILLYEVGEIHDMFRVSTITHACPRLRDLTLRSIQYYSYGPWGLPIVNLASIDSLHGLTRLCLAWVQVYHVTSLSLLPNLTSLRLDGVHKHLLCYDEDLGLAIGKIGTLRFLAVLSCGHDKPYFRLPYISRRALIDGYKGCRDQRSVKEWVFGFGEPLLNAFFENRSDGSARLDHFLYCLPLESYDVFRHAGHRLGDDVTFPYNPSQAPKVAEFCFCFCPSEADWYREGVLARDNRDIYHVFPKPSLHDNCVRDQTFVFRNGAFIRDPEHKTMSRWGRLWRYACYCLFSRFVDKVVWFL